MKQEDKLENVVFFGLEANESKPDCDNHIQLTILKNRPRTDYNRMNVAYNNPLCNVDIQYGECQ
jgi:hypothetical protein